MGDEVRSSVNGSFAPQNAGVVFDLAKEADALAILKSVHRSAIDVDTKNLLRDAVFSYRNDLDQASLTHACELFASVGMTVVGCMEGAVSSAEPALSAPTTVPSRFRTGRNAAFGRSPVRIERAAAEPKVQLKVVSAEVPLAPQEASEPPSPPPEVPEVKEESSTPSPEPAIAEVPVPEPAVPSSPEPTPTSAFGTTRPIDRINEIKKMVNDRVGNPVNLIDAHNEVGREYMNALLEAMKKTNGGQAGEVEAAMVRLEAAFAAVERALDGSTSTPTPPPEPAPAEVLSEPLPTETSAVPPHEPLPHDIKAIELPPEPPAASQVPEPAVVSMPAPAAPEVPVTPFTPVGPAEEKPLPPPPVPEPQPLPVTEVPPPPPAPFQPSSVPVPASELSSKVVSVAKAKQVEELMHKQFVEAAEHEEQVKRTAEEKMDPVMVSEVTTGLKQLLSEWSLFKSSGLFGTGPAGIDHPLYKKISNLPMQAVIAGRFEGSTAQIRQSISDYMNGWRYEEGVVFDYGESFEHYLRRVIRHILDKKKSAPKTS